MSIESLCDSDDITVETETISIGSEFGVVETFASGVAKRCLVQEIDGKERLDYASRGIRCDMELYFSANPNIDLGRRIRLDTVGGVADGRICRVTGAYKEGRPGESLLWIVLANYEQARGDA